MLPNPLRTWTARQIYLLLIGISIIASLPVWLTHGTPFVDFPNHMARVHILTDWSPSSPYAAFYKPSWTLLPNLGMDLVLVPLARFIPVELLGKGFATTVFILIITGFAALRRELHHRFDFLGLTIAPLLLFNTITGFGFMNYLMGLGLAMWSVALCLKFREAKWIPALSFVLGVALFFVHLMGFVLFALTLCVIQLLSIDRSEVKASIKELTLVMASLLPPVILLKLSSTESKPTEFFWDDRLWFKITWFTEFMRIGSYWRDIAFEIAVLAVLILAFATRLVRIDKRWLVVTGVFFSIFLAAPYEALTSAFIDARLPIWVVLISLASLKMSEDWWDKRSTLVFASLAVLGFLRTGDLVSRALQENPLRVQVDRDLEQVPEGSILLQAAHRGASTLSPDNWHPALLHINCGVLTKKAMFVANLFTIPQQQPLVDQPWIGRPLRNLYFRGSSEVAIKNLIKRVGSLPDRIQAKTGKPANVYLFYIKPNGEPPVKSLGTICADTERYTLYKISNR